MEELLLPCEGTINVIDDNTHIWKNEEEHDNRLENTLETLELNIVLLKRDKFFLTYSLSRRSKTPKKITVIQKNVRTPSKIDIVS